MKILQGDIFRATLDNSLHNSTLFKQEPHPAMSHGMTALWNQDGLTDYFSPSFLVNWWKFACYDLKGCFVCLFVFYYLSLNVAHIRFYAGMNSRHDIIFSTLKWCSTQNGSHNVKKSCKFTYLHPQKSVQTQRSIQIRGKFLKPRSHCFCFKRGQKICSTLLLLQLIPGTIKF